MAYAGGKGRCYQRIINLMPPHRVYIELFLGSGAVLRNKRPAEINIGIDLDDRVLASWHGYEEPSIKIEQRDAFKFLEVHEFDRDHLIYVDPPYLPSTRRKAKVYRHDLSEEEHERLLDLLLPLPCAVMISGYPSRLYEERLRSWSRTEFEANSHVGLRREVVWHNFDPPMLLHDYAHLGDTFRERERLKRKADRWRRRLETLPDIERQAMLSAISDLVQQTPNEARS